MPLDAAFYAGGSPDGRCQGRQAECKRCCGVLEISYGLLVAHAKAAEPSANDISRMVNMRTKFGWESVNGGGVLRAVFPVMYIAMHSASQQRIVRITIG